MSVPNNVTQPTDPSVRDVNGIVLLIGLRKGGATIDHTHYVPTRPYLNLDREFISSTEGSFVGERQEPYLVQSIRSIGYQFTEKDLKRKKDKTVPLV